jgi:uncharacterized protein YjiS (DUF1127 family)
MTDHVVTHTAFASAKEFFAAARSMLRNWRARRAVNRLQDFDDYMLRDIGVTRLDVRWASGLPLSVNAAQALEERSFRRRAGRLKD